MSSITISLIGILLVSAFPAIAAVIARRTSKPDALIAMYVMFAALSQVLAAKIAIFDFGFTTVTAPAAVIIFAVTFLITDIVNEKFGRAVVHQMIAATFVTQIALAAFLWFSTKLQPAPFWQLQNEWELIFGIVPRILFASWVTFIVSENLDAYLFARVRKITGGKHLWVRNAFSSIPALTVDTLIFVPLAFAYTDIPLWPVMVGQFTTKYIVALIDIPFMYLNRALLGERLVGDDA